MVPQNNAQNLLPYGVDAEYKEAPDEESRRTGVVPLDTLPAQWWNYLWDEVTKNFNRLNASVNALVTELNNVLTEAEKTPDATVQNQVVNSIKALINKAVGDLQTSVTADISTLTTGLGNLQTALSNEVTARTNADNTLQTNIDGKQATITGAATTITANNLTANRVLQSNASGKVAVGGVNAIGLISKDSNTSHFLRGDGTWQTPPSGGLTYRLETYSLHGGGSSSQTVRYTVPNVPANSIVFCQGAFGQPNVSSPVYVVTGTIMLLGTSPGSSLVATPSGTTLTLNLIKPSSSNINYNYFHIWS